MGSDVETSESNKGLRVGYRAVDLTNEKGTTVTVAVWYPTVETPKPHHYGGPTWGNVALDAEPYAKEGPYPLLVFSHGYGGGGLSATFLTEPLASRGWLVAAPDHHDRHMAVRIRTGQSEDFDRRGLLQHAAEISHSGPENRARYLYRVVARGAVDIAPLIRAELALADARAFYDTLRDRPGETWGTVFRW